MIGGDAHPFYRWVAAQIGEAGAPRWNFHKYLIGPDGQLAGAWPSRVGPLDQAIIGEIEGHAAEAIDEGISLSGRGGTTLRELAFCCACR